MGVTIPKRSAEAEMSSALTVFSSLQPSPRQTLTEKIVQNYSICLPEGKYIQAGDDVTLSPSHRMSHDNPWPVALKFMSIGATPILNDRQIVMTLDNDV